MDSTRIVTADNKDIHEGMNLWRPSLLVGESIPQHVRMVTTEGLVLISGSNISFHPNRFYCSRDKSDHKLLVMQATRDGS